MRIRQMQIEALETAFLESLTEGAVGHLLRSSQPERFASVPPEKLFGLVRREVNVAVGHGIRARRLLERYLAVVFRRDPDAERDSVLPILEDPFLRPAEKIAELEAALSPTGDSQP